MLNGVSTRIYTTVTDTERMVIGCFLSTVLRRINKSCFCWNYYTAHTQDQALMSLQTFFGCSVWGKDWWGLENQRRKKLAPPVPYRILVASYVSTGSGWSQTSQTFISTPTWLKTLSPPYLGHLVHSLFMIFRLSLSHILYTHMHSTTSATPTKISSSA